MTDSDWLAGLKATIAGMTPGPFKLMVKDARLEVWGADGYAVAYCGQFQGDGAGFVTLRNIAPELIAVVEAAQALVENVDNPQDYLKTALAALAGKVVVK